MTDFKELREALAAGPEPISTELLGDRYFSGDYSTASLTKEQDAFIAAANPATIRSLLAGLDEARRDAELWGPVVGFVGAYEVSSLGRVRSLPRIDSDGNRRSGGFMTPTAIRKGYLKVGLSRNGVSAERYVHRLVAEAFIENPGALPQVNHIDGDPANNAAGNLEWVTNAQNQTHARRVLARGVRAVFGISISDGSRIEFASLQHAVEAGYIRANIQKCVAGTRKHHRGYAWFDAAIDAMKEQQP